MLTPPYGVFFIPPPGWEDVTYYRFRQVTEKRDFVIEEQEWDQGDPEGWLVRARERLQQLGVSPIVSAPHSEFVRHCMVPPNGGFTGRTDARCRSGDKTGRGLRKLRDEPKGETSGRIRPPGPLPVLFFIHGGSLKVGSSVDNDQSGRNSIAVTRPSVKRTSPISESNRGASLCR